jgi:hypothetical protein
MSQYSLQNDIRSPRNKAAISVALILLVALGVFVYHLTRPKRSIASYCKVYSQEEIRLKQFSNDQYAYGSGVFNVAVNDASQLAISFGRLDKVAPQSVEPNAKALQKIYKSIHDSPSQTISASLSGGPIDDSLQQWTQQHCGASN